MPQCSVPGWRDGTQPWARSDQEGVGSWHPSSGSWLQLPVMQTLGGRGDGSAVGPLPLYVGDLDGSSQLSAIVGVWGEPWETEAISVPVSETEVSVGRRNGAPGLEGQLLLLLHRHHGREGAGRGRRGPGGGGFRGERGPSRGDSGDEAGGRSIRWLEGDGGPVQGAGAAT